MTLTGTKMNPITGLFHYDRWKQGPQPREGTDEIVECEDCGWTWWVHHA